MPELEQRHRRKRTKCMGNSNERGQMHIDFGTKIKSLYENSIFKQNHRRLYTWKYLDGKAKYQIRYIFDQKPWKSCVL